MYFKIVFIVLSLLLTSCSKKKDHGEKFTEEEWKQITLHLPPVNPQGENSIPFHEYSPGVNRLNSKVFIVEKLRFFAIEFENEDQAELEAKRLNQYYAKNYLFDQVEGEPLLEDFVIETFKAKNPNRKVQKVVHKKAEHGHGESHGEAHGEAPKH